MKANVVLTTYEILLKDKVVLLYMFDIKIACLYVALSCCKMQLSMTFFHR